MPELFQDFDPAAFWTELGAYALLGLLACGTVAWLLHSLRSERH